MKSIVRRWLLRQLLLLAVIVVPARLDAQIPDPQYSDLPPDFLAALQSLASGGALPATFGRDFAVVSLKNPRAAQMVIGETISYLEVAPGLRSPQVLPALRETVETFVDRHPAKCGALTGILIASLPPRISPSYGPELVMTLRRKIANTLPRFIVSTLNDCYAFLRFHHPETLEILDKIALEKNVLIDESTELQKPPVRLYICAAGRKYAPADFDFELPGEAQPFFVVPMLPVLSSPAMSNHGPFPIGDGKSIVKADGKSYQPTSRYSSGPDGKESIQAYFYGNNPEEALYEEVPRYFLGDQGLDFAGLSTFPQPSSSPRGPGTDPAGPAAPAPPDWPSDPKPAS